MSNDICHYTINWKRGPRRCWYVGWGEVYLFEKTKKTTFTRNSDNLVFLDRHTDRQTDIVVYIGGNCPLYHVYNSNNYQPLTSVIRSLENGRELWNGLYLFGSMYDVTFSYTRHFKLRVPHIQHLISINQ